MFNMRSTDADALLTSQLYDQDAFYQAFLKDMSRCQEQLIIESPFITSRRIEILLPVFHKLAKRGVQIVINTRDPEEHNDTYRAQAEDAVTTMQALGIKVLYTAGHHRKIAVVDESVTWEGSLNILSHYDSCEIMRRIQSSQIASQMVEFLQIGRFIG